ncbi:hypothetical protein GCM10010168_62210 [Actinoplanes ianthinogenes]|uniref:N-acetyltransferase domain-containing protein n=1 Tax=Actinoplanes ianthinogenes TaxID=122358 RepID=A0ABM7LJU2_9ACTN|nr:hypothetical protein [Actinoplanes ianthinogenes]BCJ39531.1 hypothetical protein Aiant_01880 [Actinoplanes ianthinogenes]GGR35463.1 hypothetical protein GCM10010168_62210 [Actinoplanes ianthinogenes]
MTIAPFGSEHVDEVETILIDRGWVETTPELGGLAGSDLAFVALGEQGVAGFIYGTAADPEYASLAPADFPSESYGWIELVAVAISGCGTGTLLTHYFMGHMINRSFRYLMLSIDDRDGLGPRRRSFAAERCGFTDSVAAGIVGRYIP